MTSKLLLKICKAHGVAVDGDDEELLDRLYHATPLMVKHSADKKRPTKQQDTSKLSRVTSKIAKKSKAEIQKIKPLQHFKGGGVRLNAAYYYHVVCRGKISECEPQQIQEPNGSVRLKKVGLVKHARGVAPRWVICK